MSTLGLDQEAMTSTQTATPLFDKKNISCCGFGSSSGGGAGSHRGLVAVFSGGGSEKASMEAR